MPVAFQPGRLQPVLNQPGNAFAPNGQPDLSIGRNTNPTGTLPANPAPTRGIEAWTDMQFQAFRSDGTNMVWVYQTPVFDLRPGLSQAYGTLPAAVPINHEAALGQSIYLGLTIGEASGVRPPALSTMTVVYDEIGSVIRTGANIADLRQLIAGNDITETVLAGGTATAATAPNGPYGASAISFTPCITGLRFWKIQMTITFQGLAPIAFPYFIEACLH